MKLISLFMVAIMVVSCSKDDDNPPETEPQAEASCHIISTSGGLVINMTYDETGRLKTLVNGTKKTTYFYTDNQTISATLDNGEFEEKKIMTFNENGQMVNLRIEFNQSGTEWNNEVYEYNGEQIIKSTRTSYTGSPPSVHTYVWSNGNMVTQIYNDGGSAHFEYYLDELVRPGDFFHTTYLLIFGVNPIKNTNLTKSTNFDGDEDIYTYEFDDEGKITSLILPGSGQINYNYECD